MRHFNNARFAFVTLVSVACVCASCTHSAMGAAKAGNLPYAFVLWENTASGDVAIWVMDGATLATSAVVGHVEGGSGWGFEDMGDFDGNGTTDVLWLNALSGDVAVWLMDGPTLALAAVVAQLTLPTSWQVFGIGDFDGDGNDDILWWNSSTGDVAMWLMNGSRIETAGIVVAALSLDWRVRRVGDYDGDGDDDLLLRNAPTDEVALWLTDGLRITGAGVIASGVTSFWRTQAAVDLNDDGIDDVLWRHLTTGDLAVWFMNGVVSPTGTVIVAGVPGIWHLEGVEDLDRDGDPDLLWSDPVVGNVAVWIMNGRALVAGAIVANVAPSTNWVLRGVGHLKASGQAWP